MNNYERIMNEAVNQHIITQEKALEVMENGEVLFLTYQELKKRGLQVRKGEKAKFKCVITKCKETEQENNGKKFKTKEFFPKYSYFFTKDQCDKIEKKEGN